MARQQLLRQSLALSPQQLGLFLRWRLPPSCPSQPPPSTQTTRSSQPPSSSKTSHSTSNVKRSLISSSVSFLPLIAPPSPFCLPGFSLYSHPLCLQLPSRSAGLLPRPRLCQLPPICRRRRRRRCPQWLRCSGAQVARRVQKGPPGRRKGAHRARKGHPSHALHAARERADHQC